MRYNINKSKILVPVPNKIIEMAKTVALDGNCNRLQVGAVVWNIRNIGGSNCWIGCNRTPIRSSGNCNDHGHLIVEGHCIRASHAEVVAIAGRECGGMYLHVTHLPCPSCVKLALEVGIVQITWETDYGNTKGKEGTIQLLQESRLFWGRVGKEPENVNVSLQPPHSNRGGVRGFND